MEDYYFVYRNSMNKLGTATNIKFIAEHKACVAVPKSEIDLGSFRGLDKLLFEYSYNNNEIAKELLLKTDIIKIMW